MTQRFELKSPGSVAPDWWSWDIELSPHVLKRMVDRSFTEADLRLMLEGATALRTGPEPTGGSLRHP